jgi:hypothetical protein
MRDTIPTPLLNKRIRTLKNDLLELKQGKVIKYYEFLDHVAPKEFKTLYYADSEFLRMSRSSIRIMVKLNLQHKFIPHHLFGIEIDLEKQ